jgi:hypothetical protein
MVDLETSYFLAPDASYHFPENNPKGYQHPGERGMDYEDVKIETVDGETLHG